MIQLVQGVIAMKMFSKCNCIICNSEASMLNRLKLNDGNFLCGDCLSRLNICENFNNIMLKELSIDEIKERMVYFENDKKDNAERISRFKATTQIGGYIWFDDNNKFFVFPKGTFSSKIDKSYVFKYEEILNFEVLEDGTSVTKGGLGKALVGGAVFGLAGAIAGGSSKKTKQICTKLQIKITTRNANRPVVYLSLIDTEFKKDSFVYKQASKTIQDILSKFQIIIDELEKQNNIANEEKENRLISPVDEIKKYKELLDMGVISQEEFDKKKKELLNL